MPRRRRVPCFRIYGPIGAALLLSAAAGPAALAEDVGPLAATAVDLDQDGLDDQLEQVLAGQFFPASVWFHPREGCAWPATPSSPGLAVYRVRRDPRDERLLSITYSIHYREDCGSFLGIDSHPGDIESFAVVLAPDAGCGTGFRLHAVKTTAHAGGPANTEEAVLDSCGPVPDYFVSLGKHAGYLSIEACDGYVDPFQKCARGFLGGFDRIHAGEEGFRLADDLSSWFPSQAGGPVERIWLDPGDGRFCGGLAVGDRAECVGAAYQKLQNEDLLAPIRRFETLHEEGRSWNRGAAARDVAFGDVDGDGRDELAVARRGARDGAVLLYDDAAGGFAPLPAALAGWGRGDSAVSIAFGDVDGDGLDEMGVIRGALRGPRVLVYDDAERGFALLFSYGEGWGERIRATSIAFGDVDGDGLDEVAVTRFSARGARLHLLDDSLHDFDPLMAYGKGWKGSRLATGVAFGDVDGDGRDEMGVTRRSTAGDLIYVLDDAENGYAMLLGLGGDWADGRHDAEVAFGDVDGDGLDETMVTRRSFSGDRVLLLDDSVRGFSALFSAGNDWEAGAYRTTAALGDGDGDGRAEILVARNRADASRLFLYQELAGGNGFGLLGSGGRDWPGTGGVLSAAFGDVDGDGLPEAAVALGGLSGARIRILQILAPDTQVQAGRP